MSDEQRSNASFNEQEIGNNGGERRVSGKGERKFDNGGLDNDMMIRLVYAHVDMTFSMIR